jgi:hypothetical protein
MRKNVSQCLLWQICIKDTYIPLFWSNSHQIRMWFSLFQRVSQFGHPPVLTTHCFSFPIHKLASWFYVSLLLVKLARVHYPRFCLTPEVKRWWNRASEAAKWGPQPELRSRPQEDSLQDIWLWWMTLWLWIFDPLPALPKVKYPHSDHLSYKSPTDNNLGTGYSHQWLSAPKVGHKSVQESCFVPWWQSPCVMLVGAKLW